MRRNPIVAVLVVWASLTGAAASVAAATRIEAPGVMVYLPRASCEKPDKALFARLGAETLGDGWRLAGTDARRWALDVDLVRAASLGVPLSVLRERLGQPPASVPTDETGIARVLLEGTVPLPKGEPVPLQAFVALQVSRFRDEAVLVDRAPVVAAVPTGGVETDGTLLSAVRAAAALAHACGQPIDAVQILVWPPRRTVWRIAYRAGRPEAEGAWTRAEALEGVVAAARGGGRTVGVHRPTGGAIWGLLEGGRGPNAPAATALHLPDTHVLVHAADGSFWRHPFQAVIRFEAAGGSLAPALDAARQLAKSAGHDTRVVFREEREAVGFTPDEAQLAAAGLQAEDLTFALDGTSFSLLPGEEVEVRISTATPAAERRVVGADGDARPLSELGAVSQGRRVVGLPGPAGEGTAVYVCVPYDAVRPAAIALSGLALGDDVRYAVVNWNVLSQGDGMAILDWWAGAR